jgi:L-lactate dehydrogenase complex protein LldG
MRSEAMNKNLSARESILAKVRSALEAETETPLEPPASARFEPRTTAGPDREMDLLLVEVRRLSGQSRKVQGPEGFASALAELVKAEGVRKASFSDHPLYLRYGLVDLLARLGVEIVPPTSDRRRLADCYLGLTVVDGALPETGTVLLRTTKGQPDLLSLLPRVHLALVTPDTLLPDLHHAFALAKGDRHFVLVSGSSRTADIEKVLTLGAHGPKSYHLWICL